MCKYDADAFCFICGEFVNVRDIKYKLNKNVKLSILFGIKTSHGLRISLITIVKNVRNRKPFLVRKKLYKC